MSVSRRRFVGNAFVLGLLSSILPAEEARAIAQDASGSSSPEDAPHDPYEFWNGFFDSVNPATGNRGRDVGQGLADSNAQTQYLFHDTERKLRWANQIQRQELLDHDGDVAVSIMLSQFRPGTADQKVQASQLRVDATQTSPYMNLFAPLAWTAIASLMPNQAGKIPSLDQMGFKSDQAMTSSSHILLTQGSGKLAVNISRAPNDSTFLKILNGVIKAAKAAAPMISLPAISIPALSTFTEAFAYWEDRTRFLMNGNLVRAIATQQAFADPQHEASYIGLVSGDYVMVAQKHADEMGQALPSLDIEQGYLVAKNGDQNMPVTSRAQATLPHITYATMRVAVMPVAASSGGSKSAEGGGGEGESSGGGAGKSGGKGKKGSGQGSGGGKGKSGSSSGKSGSGTGESGSGSGKPDTEDGKPEAENPPGN